MVLASTAMIHSYRSFGYGRQAGRGRLIGWALWGGILATALISAVVDRKPAESFGIAVFSLPWLWPAYNSLCRRTYEIRLSETGCLEFEAPLRPIRLDPFELVSIRLSNWTTNDQAYLEIRHSRGKFWVAWPIHDFRDFLDRLRRLNPAVRVEAASTLAPALPATSRRTAALPADQAPWGHDGLPTVREVVRAHPLFAVFVWFFPLFTLLALFQGTHDNLWPYLFVPCMPAMWWLLIWLNVRGWIRFDDD